MGEGVQHKGADGDELQENGVARQHVRALAQARLVEPVEARQQSQRAHEQIAIDREQAHQALPLEHALG